MSIKERIKDILNRYTHRMGEQGTKRKIKANLQVHIVMCSVMSHSLRPHHDFRQSEVIKNESVKLLESKVKVKVTQLCPTLCSPWNAPGQNTGVGSLSHLQGIFPTQGSNPGLLHCRRLLYQLSHQGSPSSSLVLSCMPQTSNAFPVLSLLSSFSSGKTKALRRDAPEAPLGAPALLFR